MNKYFEDSSEKKQCRLGQLDPAGEVLVVLLDLPALKIAPKNRGFGPATLSAATRRAVPLKCHISSSAQTNSLILLFCVRTWE